LIDPSPVRADHPAEHAGAVGRQHRGLDQRLLARRADGDGGRGGGIQSRIERLDLGRPGAVFRRRPTAPDAQCHVMRSPDVDRRIEPVDTAAVRRRHDLWQLFGHAGTELIAIGPVDRHS
jgi:hypothetical protein